MEEPKHKTSEQALNALMRYCSRAERSSGDCLRLMQRWGVEETEQSKIISRLIELQFVDDQRFAMAYVRDKMRFAGWGRRKIEFRLKAKGITKEIIKQSTSELNIDQMQERLTELLERKRQTIKTGNEYEIRGKLFRFAASRGYGYDEIVGAIDKLKIDS